MSKIGHESWNFPAGVSFALKQNMYWGGSCAFLPDISGLGGCFSFGVQTSGEYISTMFGCI